MLVLQFLNFLVRSFLIFLFAVFLVVIEVNCIENMEETFLSNLLGRRLLLSCLFVLLLLLDNLNCDVLSFLPLNGISIRLFDLISFKKELFDDLLVSEPLVFSKIELEAQLCLVLRFMALDPLKVLQNLLILISNLEAKFTILQSLKPIVLESLGLKVMVPD